MDEDRLSLAMVDLDMLMPMHLLVSPTGHIFRAGPTASKLVADTVMGRRFLEIFEVRRPRSIVSARDLIASAGTNLRLQLRSGRGGTLKGMATALPGSKGILVNLSFGIGVVDAVRDYGLIEANFASTDLAVELLYLVEAKTGVMDELRQLNERLQGARTTAEQQAQTDTLTGLANRRALEKHFDRLKGLGRSFSLMQLDLDYFKDVNDTFGHAAGDHVLQIVAGILREESREQDIVARVGGDEFVVLFDELIDEVKLLAVAKRIVDRLEQPIDFQGQTCRISGSGGIAVSTHYASPDIAEMFTDADVALYASKRGGRAQVRVAERRQAPSVRESG